MLGGNGFMSGMMSGMLSPKKDENKSRIKSKSEDEGYVDISEADTLIESEHESDDNEPAENKDLPMARSFPVDADSDEETSIYEDQVYSSKTHFTHDKEVSSGDDWGPDDAEVDPPMQTYHFKGLFDKFNSTTKADEEFEVINPKEAEGAANGRAARLNAATQLVRRKHELRNAAPSPEQLRCPCLYDEKNGWRRCPEEVHKELAKLMKVRM